MSGTSDVCDLLTGERVASGADRIEIDTPAYATRLYTIQPPGKAWSSAANSP
ncbi:MAG: hypothetical protein NTW86_04295 [Candidatus Sumerlaeota bacterium]|nr:hypothetical protein [Candidatus Sumerlaeota bacterium]